MKRTACILFFCASVTVAAAQDPPCAGLGTCDLIMDESVRKSSQEVTDLIREGQQEYEETRKREILAAEAEERRQQEFHKKYRPITQSRFLADSDSLVEEGAKVELWGDIWPSSDGLMLRGYRDSNFQSVLLDFENAPKLEKATWHCLRYDLQCSIGLIGTVARCDGIPCLVVIDNYLN